MVCLSSFSAIGKSLLMLTSLAYMYYFTKKRHHVTHVYELTLKRPWSEIGEILNSFRTCNLKGQRGFVFKNASHRKNLIIVKFSPSPARAWIRLKFSVTVDCATPFQCSG